MFGGLAFLINGNMSVAAGSQRGLHVRVDRDESDQRATQNRLLPVDADVRAGVAMS